MTARLSPTLALLQRVRRGYAPPPALRISEFADQEIILTSGPLAGTRWQTDFAPYQRGIMDAFHEPGVEIVVVMGSSQWGKTSIAVNVVAYHMAHDPCNILVVEPTVDPMAKDFSKNRLEPTIAASPVLRDIVSRKRMKDASNTTLEKTFRGGYVAMTGANSAASLAARVIRVLILDEVDRYDDHVGDEGSTIAVALKRTTTWRRRRRILMLSSPTLVGYTIDAWHQRGDQRRYYVPCPQCQHMHTYEWKQVRWTENDPRTARIHCPACDYAIGEAERVAILRLGEWRAEHPDRFDPSIVSFHMWEAYSPLSSLAEIVKGFLRARELQKVGDPDEMHTWQNTTLGEPYEPDRGDGVEPHVLLQRREAYEGEIDCPADVACLTMGVDVQDDRLEAIVLGWGVGEACWIIDRVVMPGATDQPDPWAQLDELLAHTYLHATGQRLSIEATCIDSGGHRTSMVYAWGARQAARRVFVIIGRDGQRPLVSSPSEKRFGRESRPVRLYTIGVDAAKALIVSRLNLTEKGPGFVHLPMADWCDEELAAQLTSERLVKVWHRGLPEWRWKKLRPRNEALDMFVYGLGALKLLNPDLPFELEKLRHPTDAPPPAPKKPGWLGARRPGGWLRG